MKELSVNERMKKIYAEYDALVTHLEANSPEAITKTFGDFNKLIIFPIYRGFASPERLKSNQVISNHSSFSSDENIGYEFMHTGSECGPFRNLLEVTNVEAICLNEIADYIIKESNELLNLVEDEVDLNTLEEMIEDLTEGDASGFLDEDEYICTTENIIILIDNENGPYTSLYGEGVID